MRTQIILFLLVAVMLVTGCGGSGTATQAYSPTAAPEIIQAATPAVKATLELAVEAAPPPGCTVVSPQPTPGPTEASIFPPVEQGEWQYGPQGAPITFVEYGDFQ